MKKGILYIALATIFFSTMEIALHIISTGFNPMQMNFIRFLIGSVLLLPLALRGLHKRKVHLRPGDFAFFMLTGFICVVVSMTFYQLAVMHSEASVVAVLFSCNPIFVIPFALLFLHEKIRRTTVVSIVFSIAGILFIMNPFHMGGGFTGIFFTLLSAVTFALYAVIGKRRGVRYGGVALTAFSFLMGSLELLALILLSHTGPVAAMLRNVGLGSFAQIPLLQGVTAATLPGLLYISIFVTGLGYAFYQLSMEETSAAMASMVFFIKPALAPVLAFLILGESVTPAMFGGIVLIIVGSLVAFIPGMRHAADANPDSSVQEEP